MTRPKRTTKSGKTARSGPPRDEGRPPRAKNTGPKADARTPAKSSASATPKSPRAAGRSEGNAFRPAAGRAKRPAPRRDVQLDAPPPNTTFRDRDGAPLTFPDSNLKRVAAQILTERRKLWRYRPFSFPLFTDKSEQTFFFDFYVYDNQDAVIRLILLVARETPELWDRVGRFKRQYPMYTYELWTPERLAALQGPRGRLDF